MQVFWHRREPCSGFLRTVRYVVLGVGQYDSSLEASELALCPACAGEGLTPCSQTFLFLRLLVSDGSAVGNS